MLRSIRLTVSKRVFPTGTEQPNFIPCFRGASGSSALIRKTSLMNEKEYNYKVLRESAFNTAWQNRSYFEQGTFHILPMENPSWPCAARSSSLSKVIISTVNTLCGCILEMWYLLAWVCIDDAARGNSNVKQILDLSLNLQRRASKEYRWRSSTIRCAYVHVLRVHVHKNRWCSNVRISGFECQALSIANCEFSQG